MLENSFTNTGTTWFHHKQYLILHYWYSLAHGRKAESISVTIFLIVVAPFVIMMLSRAIVVYGGSIFLRIFRVRIPLKWQNVLTLGGLRGGTAVALVLSLSTQYEFKELFTSLIIPLIAINLVVNPIVLNQYLKKSNIT